MDIPDLISASLDIHVNTYIVVVSVRVCLNQNFTKLKQRLLYFASKKGRQKMFKFSAFTLVMKIHSFYSYINKTKSLQLVWQGQFYSLCDRVLCGRHCKPLIAG